MVRMHTAARRGAAAGTGRSLAARTDRDDLRRAETHCLPSAPRAYSARPRGLGVQKTARILAKASAGDQRLKRSK
jgi:hypothetical protein